MLRSTRGLLLLAIVLIVGAVGTTWFRQRQKMASQAPQTPKTLPLNTEAVASGWVWRKDSATHGIVEVRAKRFRQVRSPDLVEIEDVEVLVFKEEGKTYDRVRCATAQFDEVKGTLHSDSDVQITMDVPAEGGPPGRLLEIQSSGVTYEAKTGKAFTDRPAAFQFAQGEGKCVGAMYDPVTRELNMKSQVQVDLRGRGPGSKPMRIEAGELNYKEHDHYILLRPWSRLTRDSSVLEGGEAVITLDQGVIQKVEAKQGRGRDRQPGRDVEYSADFFRADFNDGEIQRIYGEPNARLVSTSATSRTTISSRRVDLDFDLVAGNSQLKQTLATGNAVLESVPVPRKDVPPPDTRIVRSDRVLLRMRPGGQEIDTIETQAPGRLEFVPNRPGQRHRTLDADNFLVAYGEENIIRSFRATGATTHTDPLPPPPEPKPEPKADGKAAAAPPKPKPRFPIITSSKFLNADFDPKTGELARLEQWDDFRYEEGDRRARARRATLEEARNLITLDQNARFWDTSGATAADKIVLDQKSGDFAAEGNVVSTRMPDQKGKSSSMLSNDQPLEARAARMRSAERNQKVHYEGQAVLWQGANRLWADTVDIDRATHSLAARGHVRTQLIDQHKEPEQPAAAESAQPSGSRAASSGGKAPATASAKTPAPPKTPPRAPVFVFVEAAALDYNDADRVADYAGDTHLTRPGMDVKAARLRAFLNDSKAEGSLDRAIADGKVQIIRTAPGRTVNGTGEHAEYYASDERIFLSGGDVFLADSVRGTTRGRELTYWTEADRLVVDAVEQKPVTTVVRRR